MAAKKKAAGDVEREPSVLDVDGQGADEDNGKKPGGQPGPRGPYKKKKKVGVKASDEVIAALGAAPFLAAGAVATAFGQRAVFDETSVDKACRAFKAWADTWEEVELSPGAAYASTVLMAFMSLKLEPVEKTKPPQKPKDAPPHAQAPRDPDAPGSRAAPAA